jgi:hypothetical protein
MGPREIETKPGWWGKEFHINTRGTRTATLQQADDCCEPESGHDTLVNLTLSLPISPISDI